MSTRLDTTKSQSLDDKIQAIRSAFYEEFRKLSNGLETSPWILEIYDDHVIVNDGETGLFRVDYKMKKKDVTFSARDEWVRVEKEYVDVKITQRPDFLDFLVCMGGEVKATSDGKVSGYLVRFSDEDSPDLDGDFFTKDTDFGIHRVTPVLYHHGKDVKMKDSPLGEGSLTIDDVGVWIEAQLSLRDKWEKAVLKLCELGKLGWSSGSAPHLVKREKRGKARKILSWPLGLDASLTVSPAEPQNVAFSMKSIEASDIEKLTEPEGAGDASATAKTDTSTVTQGITKMEEKKEEKKEEQKTEVKTPDILNIFQEVAELHAQKAAEQKAEGEAKNKLREQVMDVFESVLKSASPINAGAPALNLKTKRGDDAFKSFRHYLRTGDAGGIHTGQAYEDHMKTTYALLEGTQYQGQEAVPTEVLARIIEKRDQLSVARAAGCQVLPCGSSALIVPIEKASPEVFVLTAESVGYDQTTVQPMDKLTGTVYMYTRTVPISIQLLEDSTFDIENWWGRRIGRAWGLTENSFTLAGTGSGQPQGVLAGGTASVTTAGATAITAAEIVQLSGNLPFEYRDNVAWVFAQATEGSIRGLTATNTYPFVGTGGTQGGVGNIGIAQGQGWLVAPSFKVFNSSSMPAMTAGLKSVAFGNFEAGYAIVERKGLTVMRDPYTLSGNGEVAIHAYFREGGGVVNASALLYMTQHT